MTIVALDTSIELTQEIPADDRHPRPTGVHPGETMDRSSQIIDQIYGAALDASAWSGALQSLQKQFDCSSVGLYSVNRHCSGVSLVAMHGIDRAWIDAYVDQFLYDNPWIEAPEYQRPGRLRTDRSLDEHHRQPGFYRRTTLYNEWMKPQDFIYTLGTNLLQDEQIRTKLYLYRAHRAGPFSKREIQRCQYFTAHMMRAVQLARHLALQDARLGEMQNLLDRLELGVVFLDDQGRITQVNPFAQALLRQGDGLRARSKRLETCHRDDQQGLDQTIAEVLDLRQGRSDAIPRMASARRASGKRPLNVIPAPLPHVNNPFLLNQSALVLLISDPEVEPMMPGDWLRRRYGLTATEIRLVQQLTQGISLRQAAERSGLTYETARWYLKGIFQKTGTSRQAALMHLLLSDRMIAGYN